MPSNKRLLKRAAEAKRESKYVEFKESFDPQQLGEWCELLKDFVAVANTGGGVIVVGVRNNGELSHVKPTSTLNLDPAHIVDQIYKYTGSHFSEFEVHDVNREGKTVAGITVGSARLPLIFSKAGTYAVHKANGRTVEKCAFREGVIYVRHGAKSEPALAEDIELIFERRLEEVRKSWLGGIQKVVTAKGMSEVMLVEAMETDEGGRPMTVRVTDDPEAAVFGRVSADTTHPYRQTEVVREANKSLPESRPINRANVQDIRLAHGISPTSHPTFMFQPRYSSAQYSQEFVDWIVQSYRTDERFLTDARRVASETRRRIQRK